MSNIDKQALREAAERAESDSWGYDRDEFNEALTPAAVLALLDELEYYKSREERVTKLVLDNSASWEELYKKLEAAKKRIAELERKEQHSDRQSVIDALASSGEEWSDIEEYMQKWDAERAAAAGKGE
ncbi:ead/Ea22-like family protein [Enterobacter kobei]|uniref:ead/Ea22-like family protein n=1 Tax=Enterobacter kobei TaxID=208224 RepID=UPI003B2223B1